MTLLPYQFVQMLAVYVGAAFRMVKHCIMGINTVLYLQLEIYILDIKAAFVFRNTHCKLLSTHHALWFTFWRNNLQKNCTSC